MINYWPEVGTHLRTRRKPLDGGEGCSQQPEKNTEAVGDSGAEIGRSKLSWIDNGFGGMISAAKGR